jgi:hypothetical protein
MEARYYIYFLVVAIVVVVMFIIVKGVGVPAWNSNCSKDPSQKENLSGGTERENLSGGTERENFSVPYPTRKQSSIPPKIDAGISYTDYDYWSMYGWREDPPFEYPQNTINTPYDVEMNECSEWCNDTRNRRECLIKCQFQALKADGYNVLRSQTHLPLTIYTSSPRKPETEQQRFVREGYSSVESSKDQSTKRRPFVREGYSNDLENSIQKRFCFYQ